MFQKIIISIFSVIFVFHVLPVVFGQEDSDKPNIVVILADDLGWADVGWHGTEVKTPNLDSLAKSGMKLEQFYVQPVCTPTRACFLTGRYPMRYGLQVGVIKPWADYGLPTEERTLPDAFRKAGYFTAICGKWHLGVAPEFQPNQRGFDHHYGLYLGAIDYYKHTRDGGLDWHRNGLPLEEEGYSTDLIADESVRLIQKSDQQKPFFLYIAFNAVHEPYQKSPHENLNNQYADLPNKRKIYAGMVSAMDAAVGRIYDALKEKGMEKNTIIFFSSDNGGPQPGKISDNGHLRGGKMQLYEGGVRVPAFISWQGKIRSDSVSEQPMHIVDLYPTLLGIAGIKLEQKLPLDGIDIKKTLLENNTVQEREILLNTTPATGALRVGNWKIVVNGHIGFNALTAEKGQGESQKTELFDLVTDPDEKNDLSTQKPEKRQELLDRYRKYAGQAVQPLYKPQSPDYTAPKVWGM